MLCPHPCLPPTKCVGGQLLPADTGQAGNETSSQFSSGELLGSARHGGGFVCPPSLLAMFSCATSAPGHAECQQVFPRKSLLPHGPCGGSAPPKTPSWWGWCGLREGRLREPALLGGGSRVAGGGGSSGAFGGTFLVGEVAGGTAWSHGVPGDLEMVEVSCPPLMFCSG